MKKLLLCCVLFPVTLAQAQQTSSDSLNQRGTIRIQITKEENGKVTQTDTTFGLGDEQAVSLFLRKNGMERRKHATIRLLDGEDTGLIESDDFRFIMPPTSPLPPDAFRQYSFSFSDDDMESAMKEAEDILRDHGLTDQKRRTIIRHMEVKPDGDYRRKMKKSKKKRIIIIEEA